MVTFTEPELQAYRDRRAQERATAEKEKAKAADAKAKEVSKQRRAELEENLKSKWLASGGTEVEWSRAKARIVEDALAKATLEPDPEPEPKKRIPSPLPKSRYRQ